MGIWLCDAEKHEQEVGQGPRGLRMFSGLWGAQRPVDVGFAPTGVERRREARNNPFIMKNMTFDARIIIMATFIDMFAGAGGFSEGFLQVEENGQHFDFLLGSDINPTCEVTHRMMYNEQLGLNTEFLTKDITDPDFVEELLE